MNVQELLHKVAQSTDKRVDVPTAPPIELVALIVRWARQLRDWKVSTLANFATVSVSTVERVERGERVSDEALDRIALALGYEKGTFFEPRLPIGPDAVAEQMVETYGHLVAVDVAPMKTQRAVREAAHCQAFLVHSPGVPDTYDQDIATLTEWLDFASFALTSDIDIQGGEDVSRRDLYNDILKCVGELERRGLTVLSGVMPAPQPGLPDWTVAVLSITPKLTDPGAVKRKQVFVDSRHVAIPSLKDIVDQPAPSL
ncbi:helix-turn-helix domain-containing protein [Rhizobium leguminosarum]